MLKYNLVSLCNVIYTHSFKTNQLVMDNQLLFSSLEKTISPSLSIPYMYAVLSIGLRTPGLSPVDVISAHVPAVILVQLHEGIWLLIFRTYPL